MSIIFDGDHVTVRAQVLGSEEVVATFTHLYGDRAPPDLGFGEAFFGKHRISGIYFIAKWSHWWQTPEMMDAADAVRRHGLLSSSRRRVGYGSSMGAYGALLHSGRLNLDTVLALTPQFSISPTRTPFAAQWRPYAEKITFVDDEVEKVASRIARLIVSYDPYFDEDAWHGREICRRLPNAVPLLVPFCGHPATEFFQAAGMLQDLVLTVVRSGNIPPNFARLRREGRRRSAAYWRWLGSHLLNREDWRGAIIAAERSNAIDPGRAQVWKMLALALNATQEHTRARDAVAQAFRIAPSSAEIQRLHAALHKHVSA